MTRGPDPYEVALLAATAARSSSEPPYQVARRVVHLYKMARRVAGANLAAVNGPVHKSTETLRANAVDEIRRQVSELFPAVAVTVEVDGDPRGYSVHLTGLPGAPRNSLGGEWGLA